MNPDRVWSLLGPVWWVTKLRWLQFCLSARQIGGTVQNESYEAKKLSEQPELEAATEPQVEEWEIERERGDDEWWGEEIAMARNVEAGGDKGSNLGEQ